MFIKNFAKITIFAFIFFIIQKSLVYCSVLRNFHLENNDVIFVTLSSVKKFNIEINWNCSESPKEIRLYKNEPIFDDSNILFKLATNEKSGFVVTNTTYDPERLPPKWRKNASEVTTMSENYCATIINVNNEITKTNCFRIQPSWMSNNRARIGEIPLSTLVVPGTHNSGCFGSDPEIDDVDPIFKYIHTQDVDVYTQLVFGIRYLDLRVGYYNTSLVKESFWVNHDKFKVNLLTDILNDVKQFLEKSKDEIIILDFHRFPVGFRNPNRHSQLVQLLDKEIGHLVVSRTLQNFSKGPTLNEIWKYSGRIIVCYGDALTAAKSEYLWDPLTQKWGNKQSPEDLQKYLLEIRLNYEPKSNNPLWASMAELTATPAAVIVGIFSTSGGLAQMADMVNRNLSSWYRYSPCNMNIVATDYFLGNDMINIAIECNLNREI